MVEASERPEQFIAEKFKVTLNNGNNTISIGHLSGDGLRFKNIVLCASDEAPAALKPTLKFRTIKEYESECGEPAVMLDSTYVRLFAPKRKGREANIIFKYLVKAYDELYHIVGMHTEYKIVVYHFPENSEHAFGGTSNYTIWYGYNNLKLSSQKEWTRYKVPHVSGYIEPVR